MSEEHEEYRIEKNPDIDCKTYKKNKQEAVKAGLWEAAQENIRRRNKSTPQLRREIIEHDKARATIDQRIKRADASASVTLCPGDCRDILANMADESVHLVLTDPPYFLDRLDNGWCQSKIERSQRNAGVVGGLPVGMKFDREQAKRLQAFLAPIAVELLRVLKPGGFLLLFAAPRLYHRAAVAAEDAGFEIRDAFAWRFTRKAQYKAFTMDHFVRRRDDMTDEEKAAVLESLDGRRTPQLRPQFEAILCAQKPREGTFVDNWLAHGTGLIDSRQSLTARAPETVMTVEKETRDRFNDHLTPKPVPLCEHLIRLFSAKGQTVLDPFVGSGATCLAARKAGRASIGIDINPDYIEIARARLA